MPSRFRSPLVLATLLILIATAALRIGSDDSSAAVSSTLHATVGPAFDISLTFDDGSAVGTLPAGSYKVVVSDLTPDHNFHLYGPGVNEQTGVDFTGSTAWNVTFRAGGTYNYVCDVHADSMFGSFNAGGASSDPTPAAGGSSGGGSTSGGSGSTGSSGGTKATGGSSTRSLGTLQAALDAAGKLRLTLRGKAVKTLAPGWYTIAVVDGSKGSAVALRRTGGGTQTLSGLGYVGKRSVAVNLAAGRWTLFSSARPAGVVSFRVTGS